MWRSIQIFSKAFDQPVHHNNPFDRDPFPSSSVFSSDAKIGAVNVKEEIFRNSKGGLTAPKRLKRFTYKELSHFQNSPAYSNWNFHYTDHNGWFFSPYEASMVRKMGMAFGKWLEGSLFDYQFGDLMDMAGGCTAGDVRVQYYVSNPDTLSALGKNAGGALGISTSNSNHFPIGFAFAGIHNVDDMMNSKTTELRQAAWMWAAALVIVGSIMLVSCGGVGGLIGGAVPSIIYFGIFATTHGFGNTKAVACYAGALLVWTGIVAACAGGSSSKLKSY